MARWNIDRGKKLTGGVIHKHRKKRKFQRVSLPLMTKIGKEKKSVDRRRGGVSKIRLVETEFANIIDQNTKKMSKVKILDVIRNEADPQSVRRGIITKGAIIKTELGEAKVVSRPSQHGVVNAVLLK